MVKCVSESHINEIFVDNPVVSRDTNVKVKSCESGGGQQSSSAPLGFSAQRKNKTEWLMSLKTQCTATQTLIFSSPDLPHCPKHELPGTLLPLLFCAVIPRSGSQGSPPPLHSQTMSVV